MTDPRIIALSSNPGQVEPGPFSEDELREQWNAQADKLNQWESLDSSEQLAWAQARAIAAQPADQAEGPSLADIDDLCAEFSFHYEDGDSLDDDSLMILQDMITAAITRWRAPVAQPAAQPVDLATPTPALPPRVGHILRMAEIIKEVDLGNRLHPGNHVVSLAEAILAHPGFSGCHDGPAALPAQGEVEGVSHA